MSTVEDLMQNKCMSHQNFRAYEQKKSGIFIYKVALIKYFVSKDSVCVLSDSTLILIN